MFRGGHGCQVHYYDDRMCTCCFYYKTSAEADRLKCWDEHSGECGCQKEKTHKNGAENKEKKD